MQLGIRQRQIGMGHARALLAVSDPAQQVDLYRRIVESQLSVREVEDLARTAKRGPVPAGASKLSGALHKQTARQLSQRFGTKVAVKQNAQGKGRIEIVFRNGDELAALLAKLGS